MSSNLPDGVTQRQIDKHYDSMCVCSRCKREFDMGDGGAPHSDGYVCEEHILDVLHEAFEVFEVEFTDYGKPRSEEQRRAYLEARRHVMQILGEYSR